MLRVNRVLLRAISDRRTPCDNAMSPDYGTRRCKCLPTVTVYLQIGARVNEDGRNRSPEREAGSRRAYYTRRSADHTHVYTRCRAKGQVRQLQPEITSGRQTAVPRPP